LLLNTPDCTKKLLIDYAIEENNPDLVQHLLTRGAIPTHKSYVATLDSKKEALLKLLIKHGNVEASVPFEDSGLLSFIATTPLLQAMCGKFWAAALLLLDGGADVKSRLPDYMFYSTVSFTHPEILRRLLVHKPDFKSVLDSASRTVTFVDEYADTSLLMLLKYDLIEDAIRDSRASAMPFEELLRRAAEHGHTRSLNHLLSREVHCNIPNENGETTALLALGAGHQELAILLHHHGAELGDLENAGGNALRSAASNNNTEGVKILLEKGVRISDSDEKGVTALMRAAAAGHAQMVVHLLANDAMLSSKDIERRTALHYAAEEGHEVVVDILLTKGAQPNVADNAGRTAVHFAARALKNKVFELLLRKGGDGDI
jgi:ankyrin repeat protein